MAQARKYEPKPGALPGGRAGLEGAWTPSHDLHGHDTRGLDLGCPGIRGPQNVLGVVVLEASVGGLFIGSRTLRSGCREKPQGPPCWPTQGRISESPLGFMEEQLSCVDWAHPTGPGELWLRRGSHMEAESRQQENSSSHLPVERRHLKCSSPAWASWQIPWDRAAAGEAGPGEDRLLWRFPSRVVGVRVKEAFLLFLDNARLSAL